MDSNPFHTIVVAAAIDIGEPSAPAIHVLSIVQELSCRGIEVVVLVPEIGNHDLALDVDSTSVRVQFTPSWRRLGMPNSINSLLMIPHLIFILRRFDPDVVYLRANVLSFVCAILSRLASNAVVVSEHDGWISDELRVLGVWEPIARFASLLQLLDAMAVHQVRVVVDGIGKQLRDRGIPSSRIFVAGNGTDLDRIHPMARNEALPRFGLATDAEYVGFIGNLTAWQGVDLAIHALSQVTATNPSVRLLVVGDGPMKDELRSLAIREGVSSKVHFFGSVPARRANAAINCFDIALAPKRTAVAKHGMSPLKIREYAAAGRPVVAADAPGIRELSHGGWLVLHDPDSVSDLTERILELLARPDHRREMGHLARKYAESHFSWSTVVDIILKSAQCPNRE